MADEDKKVNGKEPSPKAPSGKPDKQDAGAAGKAPVKVKPAAAAVPGETAEAGTEAAEVKKPVRAKVARTVTSGIVHIKATFNNTIVTITDQKGAVIAWCSAGRVGFKGTRKSTAYAATVVAQDAARQAFAYRLQEVEVRVQGPGSGRESAIRAIQAAGLTINVIKDVTPIPHNGCRPAKRRRV